jgi:hypothetical protein
MFGVDYLHAVQALFPGARGQVLAALTRDTSLRTLRQVALAAEVSWSQTAQVIDDLTDLGWTVARRPERSWCDSCLATSSQTSCAR